MANGLTTSDCSVTATGLQFNGEPTREQWEAAGEMLASAERGMMWCIGDWLLAGEASGYVERGRHREACERFGIAYQTAAQAARVCRAFPESCRRRQLLTFEHHKEVANRPDAPELLEWAADTGATVKELRDRKRVEAREPLTRSAVDGCYESLSELPDIKFGCVYADPPWAYGNQATRAATDNHYPTMTVDDIAAMPVVEHVADDAHLHLWTTNAFLFEARDVMEAWGFEYRSVFVWVKPQMGIGNYWRVSHELLLTGIRGNAKRFNNRGLRSWGEYPRTKHSAKPEAVRFMLESASAGPYLEMFGRRQIDGWAVVGNQITAKQPELFDA